MQSFGSSRMIVDRYVTAGMTMTAPPKFAAENHIVPLFGGKIYNLYHSIHCKNSSLFSSDLLKLCFFNCSIVIALLYIMAITKVRASITTWEFVI
jgi:hypothetical protein